MQIDSVVRRWVTQSLPGVFESPNAQGCWRAAYSDAGVSFTMALSAFIDALKRMGHSPKEIRPGLYRLIIHDSKATGVRPRNYANV